MVIWLAQDCQHLFHPPTLPLFHLVLGLVVSYNRWHLGREVVGNDPLWPNCGADCCQFVVILAASFIARWPLATLFLYPYIPPTAASSLPSLRGKY